MKEKSEKWDFIKMKNVKKFCVAIPWGLMKLLRTAIGHVSRSMDRKVNTEQF